MYNKKYNVLYMIQSYQKLENKFQAFLYFNIAFLFIFSQMSVWSTAPLP